MKKVLLYGMCGMDNLGDDLMYYAIRDFLNSKDYVIDFISRMSWTSYFPMEDEPNCVKLLAYDSKLVWIEGKLKKYIPVLKSEYNKFKFRNIRYYFEAHKYEALLFLGGGYITSNQTVMTINELENMLMLAKAAKESGMKVVFSGLTVGPFGIGDGAAILAQELFSFADTISVRERFSQNELIKMGIESSLTGDNVFLINPNIVGQPKHILVTLKAHKEQSAKIEGVLEYFVDLCKREKSTVKVIPFRSSESSEEYLLNKKFCSLLHEQGVQYEMVIPSTIQELFELFRGAIFVIGSAYHSVVLSLMFHKKVFTWSEGEYYTYKIQGLLNMFSIDDVSIDSRLFESDDKCEFVCDIVKEHVQKEWNSIIQLLG